MKSKLSDPSSDPNRKSQYIVEFSAVSTFLVDFEDAAGLTERQIITKALKLANVPFENGGGFTTEFTQGDCTFAFIAVGYEPASAQITGKPLPLKPKLRLVKA